METRTRTTYRESRVGGLKVWDARTGQKLLSLQGHSAAVRSVCFSPDGKRLASASDDRTVKVWDAQTGQELLSLKGLSGKAHSVCFSPDGKRLAGSGGELDPKTYKWRVCTVKVWDAQTGQEIFSLEGHAAPVSCVAFSPDGLRLASTSWDRTVKIWDARSGREERTLTGHTGTIYSACFSPDGQRLATGGGEAGVAAGVVKVWDVHTGQEVLSLQGHTNNVLSVCFSPDGKCLASTSWDNTVRLWSARTGQADLTPAGPR